jgi:hypothetical protein
VVRPWLESEREDEEGEEREIEYIDLFDEKQREREVPTAAVAVVYEWLAEVE